MRDIDRFRGCLIGGAAGDALGYAVEFMDEKDIFKKNGPKGITEYELTGGRALISDDTQMTLFTAAGLLSYNARKAAGQETVDPVKCVNRSYLDWLATQDRYYPLPDGEYCSWLVNESRLFSRRAPGGTCLSALHSGGGGTPETPINDSKGCGGVMRVAPIGLFFDDDTDVKEICRIGAGAAALTHGHPLGWLPAAALTLIVYEISHCGTTVKDAVVRSLAVLGEVWPGSSERACLTDMLKKAVDLAESAMDDLTAIHELGEGWVGDEALAIAVYCAVRYPDDIDKALITAVNHKGDSDSTGAIAGNIVGAHVGFSGIPSKYTDHLELADVITGIADDLWFVCGIGTEHDAEWKSKYIDSTYKRRRQ